MKLTKQTPAKVTLTGTLASSTSVTGLSSTSGLAFGQVVQGTGIPADTLVQTVASSTAITLNQAATASGSQSLTFYLEPVTLAAMKLHLRVDIPDDDSLIVSYIAAARAYCEMALKQALLTSTWLLELDRFPGHHVPHFGYGFGGCRDHVAGHYHDDIIRVPRPPLQSVTSIQYVDTDGTLQTLDSSAYTVSTGTPGKIQPAYLTFWPYTRPMLDAVKVTFIAGYADDPASLPPEVFGAANNAIKLLVGHWYKHREAVSESGVQYSQIPMTVDACLATLDHGFYG